MQQFKSNLTRLINLASEKLPQTGDVYGYPGVTRESILGALQAVHALSNAIKVEDENRFDVISLKRAGSTLTTSLKEFLESNLSNEEKHQRFNDFLDNLSKLAEKTKLTYLVVVSNGLYNDIELLQIQDKIKSITNTATDLQNSKNNIEKYVETALDHFDKITSLYNKADKLVSETSDWHSSSSEFFDEIQEQHEKVAVWTTEIQKKNTDFEVLSKQIQELQASANLNNKKLEEFAINGDNHVKVLHGLVNQNERLLEEIRDTLDAANRVGMAASFEARKEELTTQLRIWQIIFVSTIGVISIIAAWFIVPILTSGSYEWTRSLLEFTVAFPLVWLGWFAAKQYGYISKIQEDYAFKAAAAMAYEGHRKAAREVNQALEETLLKFSLGNFSQNPIRLYNNEDNHGTPIHEFVAHIFKGLRIKSVSGKMPAIGEFELTSAEIPIKKANNETDNVDVS